MRSSRTRPTRSRPSLKRRHQSCPSLNRTHDGNLQPGACAREGYEAASIGSIGLRDRCGLHHTDVWLKRYCVACNVLVHGSVGSNVVKYFGIVEAEFPAGGVIFGFKRHFRVLVNGGAADAG
jgi:hypothetical protein